MVKRPAILVTGVGAVVGYGIVESLRRSGLDVRIVGMDIHQDAYGRFVADDFVQAVLASDEMFVPFVQRVVAEHQVDLIIPGIEQDLFALWLHRTRIPTQIVLNSDLCLGLSKSKLDTFHFFNDLAQPFVIPTLHGCSYVECVSRLGLPFILKPSSSYASKGMVLIHTALDFEFHTARIGVGQCIYQRRIGSDDEEYTISVFGDGRGAYFDSIVLRRRLSQEGATQKACLVEDDAAIRECVDAVCRLVKPFGPTNLQVRKEHGAVFLLEINARVSSACSIRSLMGYNEPEMCVRHFLLHETLQPTRKRRGTVVRFIADHFADDERR